MRRRWLQMTAAAAVLVGVIGLLELAQVPVAGQDRETLRTAYFVNEACLSQDIPREGRYHSAEFYWRLTFLLVKRRTFGRSLMLYSE